MTEKEKLVFFPVISEEERYQPMFITSYVSLLIYFSNVVCASHFSQHCVFLYYALNIKPKLLHGTWLKVSGAKTMNGKRLYVFQRSLHWTLVLDRTQMKSPTTGYMICITFYLWNLYSCNKIYTSFHLFNEFSMCKRIICTKQKTCEKDLSDKDEITKVLVLVLCVCVFFLSIELFVFFS